MSARLLGNSCSDRWLLKTRLHDQQLLIWPPSGLKAPCKNRWHIYVLDNSILSETSKLKDQLQEEEFMFCANSVSLIWCYLVFDYHQVRFILLNQIAKIMSITFSSQRLDHHSGIFCANIIVICGSHHTINKSKKMM